jgi:glycosyltransferase involved in cell wall biosynthesis
MRRPRVAFLSPLPPAGTGIADYAADVLDLLAGEVEIEAFHDQAEVDLARLPASCPAHRAAELAARHRERPYDLAIHQLGNSLDHAFLYEHLARFPGLLVLHDLVLHHSRARMFLDAPEARAYAAAPSSSARRAAAEAPIRRYAEELAYCYPEQAQRLEEAYLGTVGPLLPYTFPLFRIPVEVSRLTAVHNGFCERAVRDEVPGASTARLAMPVTRLPASEEQQRRLRERYAIAPDDFVVASFGRLTPEKRIGTLARAVARASSRIGRLRLLLVGPVPGKRRLAALLAKLGVADRSVVTGRVPWSELGAHMELADIAVHLRYPTARETSAALLRLLAQGRPVVLSDVENFADVPADAALRIDVTDEEGEVTRAILRLAERPERRARLSGAARRHAETEHSGERCRESYMAAIERALSSPAPVPLPWPDHWLRAAHA